MLREPFITNGSLFMFQEGKKMNYILYKCSRCKYEFILPTEDIIKAVNEGRYISCAYCGSKHIKVENKYDSLKECMEGVHVYVRGKHGLKQVR